MVATKQIYSALQLTGLMVQACDLQCPFPVEGVTCRASYIYKCPKADNGHQDAMPWNGFRTVRGILGLSDCDLESGLERIDFIIDPNYAELQCKDWTIEFHLSSNDLPQISAYNRLYVPTGTPMGPFHAIGEDRTSDLWRMKGIVTFNGHEIKESVVQFTILRKGLGVPKHYANLIKNPATSKNQEEDSLVSDFAFTIVTEEFDRISQHAVKWHEIKLLKPSIGK